MCKFLLLSLISKMLVSKYFKYNSKTTINFINCNCMVINSLILYQNFKYIKVKKILSFVLKSKKKLLTYRQFGN